MASVSGCFSCCTCVYWCYESEKEGIKYEGNWFNGLKQGKGILNVKDQMIYEGEFAEGIKHGLGKLTWPTKNTYEGQL